MTTPGHSLLPFSPLTGAELNARRQAHTEECGYIARSVVRSDRKWTPRDLERLELEADQAEEYSSAATRRFAISAMT